MKTNYLSKTLWILAALSLTGCIDGDCLDGMCDAGMADDLTITRMPLEGICSINVSGYGAVDMESDYVPNVTACEHGGAPTESLKAQAVAARTNAYYYINKEHLGTASNPVGTSTGTQVYKCSYTTASEPHYAATNATSGIVLTYPDPELGNAEVAICAFYASGSEVKYLDDNCRFPGNESSEGWKPQQAKITYNEGLTGNSITQSSAGWRNPANIYNRGCMGQNVSTCLSQKKNYNWQQILKFFYGADIHLTQLTGSCIKPPATCTTKIPAKGGIIDDKDPCFQTSSSGEYFEANKGYNGHLIFTYGWDKAETASGTWKLNLEAAGKYVVEAYVDSSAGALSAQAAYTVRANGQNNNAKVNTSGKTGWVKIGTYNFAKGGDQWVKLSDATGDTYVKDSSTNKQVQFDAIRLTPAPTCTNQCTSGARKCVGGDVKGYYECVKNSDGCLYWSEKVNYCDYGCSDGNCTSKPACTNKCTENAKQCSGDGKGYVVCQKQSDGCTDWSTKPTACNWGCDGGKCQPDPSTTCNNACKLDETKCDGDKIKTCITGADGCTAWSDSKACSNGQVCSNNACSCQNECAEGSRECSNDGYKTCAKNAAGCLIWSSTVSCKDNEVCSAGECVDQSTAPDPVDPVEPTPGDGNACEAVIDGRPSVIIDDLDPCFVRSKSMRWSELFGFGHDAHMFYSYLHEGEATLDGKYHFSVTKPGKYTIYAYIDPRVGATSAIAPYTVRAGNTDHSVLADMPELDPAWVKLGDFDLAEGNDQYVMLSDAMPTAGENANKRLLFDAIQIVPFGTKIDGNTQGPGDDDDDDNSELMSGSQTYAESCSSTPRNSNAPVPLFALVAMAGLVAIRRRKSQA